MFQAVLYFKRKTITAPPKPCIEKMLAKEDPENKQEYDKVLDKYNEALEKYKEILDDFEKIADDSIVESFILINEDDKFFDNVKEIENEDYFVEWVDRSTEFIKQKKLLKTKI